MAGELTFSLYQWIRSSGSSTQISSSLICGSRVDCMVEFDYGRSPRIDPRPQLEERSVPRVREVGGVAQL